MLRSEPVDTAEAAASVRLKHVQRHGRTRAVGPEPLLHLSSNGHQNMDRNQPIHQRAAHVEQARSIWRQNNSSPIIVHQCAISKMVL